MKSRDLKTETLSSVYLVLLSDVYIYSMMIIIVIINIEVHCENRQRSDRYVGL